MSSIFETAGFTSYNTSQTIQQIPQTQSAAQTHDIAASSASQPQTQQPINDAFVAAESIDRNKLKEELHNEVLEEIKRENQIQATEKKEENKLGPIKGLKRFIGNVEKVFVTAAEYIKGLFKGALKGGIIGGALFGSLYGFGKSKLFDNTKIMQKPIMHKLLKGKYTAPIVGGIALAVGVLGGLWNASVKSNEKRALIEHKWENTPVVR